MTASEPAQAAPAPAVPAMPLGWFHVCRSRDLAGRPVGWELGARQFVTFRDERGHAVTLDARCSHMGANLKNGELKAGRIACPLHAWEYGGDGRCRHVPAAASPPAFAVQACYPTIELAGHVIASNAARPPFEFPYFDGKQPGDLLPAKPFDFTLNLPWHLVGANAFDLQHFRVAHDRTMIESPVIESPSPFARRISATYEVTGRSMRDRITSALAGPRVTMSVTSWAGVNILVTAAFRRTTSYGMVFIRPLTESTTHVRVIVWVPRRASAIGRVLLDPLDAMIRRRFIRAFLTEDAVRGEGLRYNPHTLIEADRELKSYLDWLAAVSAGDGRSISVSGESTKGTT